MADPKKLTPEDLAILERIVETGLLPLDLPDMLRQSLIWNGILFSLRQDASPEAVKLIYNLVALPLDPGRAIFGFQILCELALDGNQAAGEILYELAVNEQHQGAVNFLKGHPEIKTGAEQQLLFSFFFAKTLEFTFPWLKAFSDIFLLQGKKLQNQILWLAPEKGLKNWAIIIQAILDKDQLSGLIESFPRFQESEQSLCLNLLEDAAPVSPAYKNALCQLFILHDFLPARDLAIDRSFFPDDPIQAALFFYLAEEWTRYEQIDFSFKLLSTAYEISDQPVRRKILSISRSAGQVDWIKALSGQTQTRWLSELSDGEWESTIQALAGANRLADLWTLAQAAPPLFCARILLALEQALWQPENPEDRAGFANLCQLALACRRNPYIFTPQAAWNSPAHEISCIALDWDHSVLAALSSQTAILRWKLEEGQTSLVTFFNGSPGTNAVSFSQDGAYLAMCSGDHRVRILDLDRGMVVKTLEGHKGLVRSLAFSPDGRFLFTASFDGTVQTWRFPNGLRNDLVQVSRQELFGLAVSADQKYLVCAGAEKAVWVYSLPGMSLVRSLVGHKDTITLLACSPGEHFAASYSRDLNLRFWNYASGKELGSIHLEEPVTSLVFHPSGQYILGGSISGAILVWAFPSGQVLHILKNHTKAVIGLNPSPEGDQLISASSDGVLIRWDFCLFNLSRTPLEMVLPAQNRIEKILKINRLSDSEKNWYLFIHSLILWRKRFDIEVTDAHPLIHMGEFDIELS